MTLICQRCGRRHELDPVLWRCPCGGLFGLDDSVARAEPATVRPASMWRYAHLLLTGSDKLDWPTLSLGEGMTPLVLLGEDRAGPVVLGKIEYLMPTLSFKDRGAVMLVAAAKWLGVQQMIADSSGNAGTAIAAYAARAGIAVDVYVPASISAKKAARIEMHGAIPHRVDGDRTATAAAAMAAVEQTGAFYASHVYNPLFAHGVKTYAFEVVEQLEGHAPDLVALPVGNGTLALGAYHGFRQLQRSGMIERVPPILAVQARRCGPIAAAFAAGATEVAPVVDKATIAEGIAVAAPARGTEILAAIRSSGGCVVTVAEEAIASARTRLAAHGLFVEPTAAVAYAGLLGWLDGPGAAWVAERGEVVGRAPVIVLPLSGAGLEAG